MKVKVDRERCIGAGACVIAAPTVFRLGKDGKSEVMDEAPANRDKLWEAAEGCPVYAIILEDDAGKRLYP